MFKTKMIVNIVVIIILIFGTSVPIFAADYTFTLTVNPETINAKLGDTISVDIGVSDIDQSTEGINAIQGDISFDEDLFESVDLVSIGNNWSVSYNNLENSELKGKFVLSNMSNVKDAQTVTRLVAKIRSDATLTTGKITLKDVYSSYGSSSTEKTTKQITVNIASSGSTDNNKNADNNIIVDNDSKSKSAAESSKINSTTQNTISNKILPKTGIEYVIVIFIAAVLIVAVIEFIKYKRLMK